MKIIVLGKNGQVAQSLQDCIKSEVEIESIFLSRDDFSINSSDILSLVEKHRPNFIINCCAYTDVEGAEDDFENAYRVNALLLKYIGEASKKFNIPVIHFSTDYVFDGMKKESYIPSDQKNPLSVYGQTKSDGEDFLLNETEKAWILRTSWVYSPYGKNFFKTMYKLLRTRKRLTVISDQIGSPTAAHDLANAVLSIIKEPASYPYGVHHISGAGETSWFGFACEIQKNMRTNDILSSTMLEEITTEHYLTKAKRPLNSRLSADIFKLKSWKDSLAEVFKHYKEEENI
ncbi:MAG: dTDP-4-dehydrorhamnose reductase [Candidatus Paracaedibacteraceae bacterium]|nr:dTDP-4-dehydrorhamnose reductase [Candidatus Paracaedibacteraceae bacterium]